MSKVEESYFIAISSFPPKLPDLLIVPKFFSIASLMHYWQTHRSAIRERKMLSLFLLLLCVISLYMKEVFFLEYLHIMHEIIYLFFINFKAQFTQEILFILYAFCILLWFGNVNQFTWEFYEIPFCLSINTSVAGNNGNQAFLEMPQQLRKFWTPCISGNALAIKKFIDFFIFICHDQNSQKFKILAF